MRLLVVEDEPDLARVLKRALVEAQCAVDVSADGFDALHQATHVGYDAIVLDLMLPGSTARRCWRRCVDAAIARRS